MNPFLTVAEDDPAGINPVLGLAYLAAYLESQGIEVKIIDIAAEGADTILKIGKKTRHGLKDEEIIKRIRNYDPLIVGITCQSTLHAKDAHETARLAKIAKREALLVMGGAHPSAAPAEVLKDRGVDLVVRGEGEVTLYEVVCHYSQKKSFEKILGISFRRGGKIINNPPRPLIRNLDGLPFPARHLLPMKIYFRQIAGGNNYSMRLPVATIISSRGCPGRCVYCAVRTVWGRGWRGRTPGNVVNEIEELIRDWGVKEIHFIDDNLSVDKKRLRGICEEIIKRKLDIKWTTPNGIAIWLLDKKLLLKMKESGCYRLTFGLESGNKEMLHDFIGKSYDLEKAREMIKYAGKIGLWTIGTFIIGFPYETREQIKQTIDYAISTELDFAAFYLANPFPGTAMYEIYKKENLLPATGVYEVVRGCRSKWLSHQELVALQGKAFSDFLKSRLNRPWRYIFRLRNWEDVGYAIKIGKSFMKMFFGQLIFVKKGIAALWR